MLFYRKCSRITQLIDERTQMIKYNKVEDYMNLPLVLKQGGNNNAAWKWMLATLFLSQMFPEYIAPFFTLIGFVVMKISFKKNGQKVRMDSFGKYEFIFLAFYLFTSVYSNTKIYSALIALLWMGMCLGQLMMANLINTEEKLKTAMKFFTVSAFILSIIGCIQSVSNMLIDNGIITRGFPNPLTGPIDNAFYDFLVDKFGITIKDYVDDTRAMGTYSNPNLFVSFLICAAPFAFHFFLNGENRRERIFYGIVSVTICAGAAVAQTRGAMIALIISIIFLFLTNKKYFKKIFVMLAGFICFIPALLSRYYEQLVPYLNEFTYITQSGNVINVTMDYSLSVRVKLYTNLLEYIFSHFGILFFGLGAGVENVYALLKNELKIDVPHAHSILLELWAESGLIGLALFLLAGGILFVNLVRTIKMSEKGRSVAFTVLASLMAFFIMGLTDFIICSPKILQVMFLVLGFAQATYRIYQGRWKNDKVLKTNMENSKEFITVSADSAPEQ